MAFSPSGNDSPCGVTDKDGTLVQPARRRGLSADKTANTRRQISEAALALFIEQGIASTSVAQIAARAGVGKGTIYCYFPSKETLLRGVIEHALRQSVAGFGVQRQPGESVQHLLRRSALPAIEAIDNSERAALARMILAEAPRHPQLGHLYKELAFDPWHRHIHQLLQLAATEGELPASRVEDGAHLLSGPFWMGMVHNGLLCHEASQHVAIAPLMDQCISLLFAGDAAGPSHQLAAQTAPAHTARHTAFQGATPICMESEQ